MPAFDTDGKPPSLPLDDTVHEGRGRAVRAEYVGEDPIMKIACVDPLYVEVVVPAEKFGVVKKGVKAGVTLDFPKPGKYNASVIIVDRVIDAASGTFGVRLILPNPDYLLPAGLKCMVTFPTN